MKRTISLTESELRQIISESVKKHINEVSADMADRAAGKALSIGREGFGKYGNGYEIPFDSYHGKKFMQGDNFLKYRNNKLGLDNGYSIYYPDGTGDVMVLKDPNGDICTKPCHSIKELEMEYNNLQNESYNRMKRTIRLTESELRQIISESVKRVLNEGGHLYGKDEDGNIFTNSKETYRGVPGSVYISHGEWADAEILWDGVELNASDVEDSLWYSYKDDCQENGEEPTNEGYEAWLEEMGTDYIASQLDDLAWSAEGCH